MGWNKVSIQLDSNLDFGVDPNSKNLDFEFLVNAIKKEFPFMDIFLVEHAVKTCLKSYDKSKSNLEFIYCLKQKLDGFM